MRFSDKVTKWKKYKVSDLLICVPTNSLTWNELSYDEESSLKNIHYGLIHNGFTTTCISCDNKLIPYVNSKNFPKQYSCVEKGDIILADASEDRKDVGRAIEIIDISDEIFISGLHTIHAKNKSNLFETGYKGYYFNSNAMKKQIHRIANGSKIYSISPSNFNELYISIPNKHEQTKIVSLLSLIEHRIETQNKIINNLESQKKFISKLLFDSLECKTKLCILCDIKKGQQLNGDQLLDYGKYYMMNGGITPSGFTNTFNTNEHTISISEGGNSCGYVQYNFDKFWSGGHCYTLEEINPIINKKYLYHFLKHKENEIMALRIGTGLPNIQKKDLERFMIPTPIIEQQIKITKVLDAVDKKLKLLNEQLAHFYLEKKYLLNNMFI